MAEGLACEKHFSLLGPFVIHEENEVLWMKLHSAYSKHSIFFVIGPISEGVA